MIRKWALIQGVFLAALTASASFPWGASMEEMNDELGRPHDRTEAMLVYKDTISFLEALRVFHFVDDKLVYVSCRFEVDYSPLEYDRYYKDFLRIKKLLIGKYRFPVKDLVIPSEHIPKDSLSYLKGMIGIFLLRGDVQYKAYWITEDMEIMHWLRADPDPQNDVIHSVGYVSLEFRDLYDLYRNRHDKDKLNRQAEKL